MTDRNGKEPKPIAKDPTGWVAIGAFAVLMAIVIGVIVYAMYKDIRAPEVIQRCSPGMCKFNVFTGVKTCPNPGDTTGIRLLEGNEYCTSPNFCQQTRFQCAVQADQSIDCTGECDQARCRCVANPELGLVGI